jgi:peroxiredoxin
MRLALVLILIWMPALPLAAAPPEEAELGLEAAKRPFQAPDFEATTVEGRRVVLSALRGRVVLLSFWSTDCLACIEEFPALERLHRAMAGRPFALLVINKGEPEERVRRWFASYPFTFEKLLDPGGDIASLYRAINLPVTYIIDRDGLLIRRALGKRAWDGPAALTYFLDLTAR